MFRVNELDRLAPRDPKAAAEKIAGVIASTENHLGRAAETLGVDYRTLTRWLTRLLDRYGIDVRQRALEIYVDRAQARAIATGESPKITLPSRARVVFKPRWPRGTKPVKIPGKRLKVSSDQKPNVTKATDL